jgi:uncharacterized protein YcnI
VGVGRRRAGTVLLLVATLVGLAGPAWAHGQVRPGRAAAGATIDTVLVVPSERDGHGNSRIALALPPEFTPRSCRSPVGWRCTTEDKGFTWDRVTGLVEATDFDLTMTVAATAGTYVLPLAQTYDDGETRTFAGGPGTRDEAPLFTVTGTGGSGTSPHPTAATAAHRTASPTARPSPEVSPSTTSTSPPAATTAGRPSLAGTAASGGPSSAPGGLGALPAGRRLAPASSGDAPVALIALALVGIVVLGGLVLLVRRRPSPPS